MSSRFIALVGLAIFIVVLLDTALSVPMSASHIASQVHRRVKRQYFKPSIDGNILGNERRNSVSNIRPMSSPSSASVLNINESTNPNATTMTSVRNNSTFSIGVNSTSSCANCTATSETNEITVTSLALSLINLFDRVKATLCHIINQSPNCT